ncbi:MAG: hypothetical protein HS105_06610 [Chloracidobacterium sp.]|nr:hypothetical protein [Chloracidobacterium sp.]
MRKFTAWTLLVSIYIGTFAQLSIPVTAQVVNRSMDEKMKNVPKGLTFRLSEGVEGAEKREPRTAAATEPLSDTETGTILKRLPAIKADADDETDFAKRAGTLPAPKKGEKLPVTFPADESRTPANVDLSGKTLEVLRYSPNGEVDLAPDLSVTFSQPMVAVGSQSDAAKFAPVEFAPQVEGQWRWLGTRTLMFDTTKRFPMATEFTARVPAGTRSANGPVLDKDVIWKFTTPAPKLLQQVPSGDQTKRDAVIFASFDQAIDPAAVLAKTSVSAGGKRLQARLATQEEVNADPSISYYARQAEPGRWLAFRAITPDGSTANALPASSTVTVTFDKGMPSAEGPLTTTAARSFTFKTYGQFKFTEGYCGYSKTDGECTPSTDWYIVFTNTIDPSKFTKDLVKIEPAIEDVKIEPYGNRIRISGYKKGRTTYKVTVDPSLTDQFGQQLGTSAVASIKVGSESPHLFADGKDFTVLDPFVKPTYSIYSINHGAVKVRLYAVEPTDWGQFQQYLRYLNYDEGKRPAIPGRMVLDTTLNIRQEPDVMVETPIDISKALKNGLGNVIVDIETVTKPSKYERSHIFKWLQSTQIGLDAFVDNEELVGFASDLKTGKPLSDVEMSIYPNGAGVADAKSDEQGPGVLASIWDWLTSSGPSSDTTLTDADGNAVAVDPIESAQTERTGANGVLRLKLGDRITDKGPDLLIAKRGNDVAFLPSNADNYWVDSPIWYRRTSTDTKRWFVFDDRNIYRPKEEVSVKGYIRVLGGGKFGDIAALPTKERYSWSAKDARGNEFAKGSAETNAFGAFDLKFSIPDNVNLGYAQIDLTLADATSSQYSHQFQIQEFRRPEFEVSTKVESEAPFIIGDSVLVSAEAKYYAGGGLAGADTEWTVVASATNYTPPNRDDFTFGTWVPWWRDFSRGTPSRTVTFDGKTDASGKHLLKIDLQSVNPPRPYTITAWAAVQDVNRQTWASNTSLLVHPSELYIGMRTPRTFVQKGEQVEVESIVTDIDGKLVPGRNAEIKAVLKDWVFEKGSWEEKIVDEQTCSFNSSAQQDAAGGPKGAKCSITAKRGGTYTITATVMDDRERFNQSEITVWVPGGQSPPERTLEKEDVQIIPAKKDHSPGDVAEFLVIAPFSPAEGILTLRRDGLVKAERFTMTGSSITLKVPIEERYLPNIHVQVDLVGSAPRADGGEGKAKAIPRPAFASGDIDIKVSTASRKLTVSAEPAEKTLAPGGKTKIDIAVKDFRGEPAADTEVAVVAVDESVLALTGYTISDPMSTFYTERSDGVSDRHLRENVVLAQIEGGIGFGSGVGIGSGISSSKMAVPAPMAARRMNESGLMMEMSADAQSDGGDAIRLRSNFDALALWSPSVRTDANGHAAVEVKLPDNLTRYRITAVAVDTGKRFGKAESTITARQPLMVRPSAPRFLNFGDKAELPVVVQNQTDHDMAVDVAVRATNAAVAGPGAAAGDANFAGKRVLVKANDREEVRFPVLTAKAGTARFQIAVTSGKYSDAAEISLPVWTPATSEAFATYGTTDKNGAIVQPVQAPNDVFPQFGGLEVTTSSTQLQELTDAFIYLTRYPFDCSEQIASRMISIAAMRDVLTAFKAKEMPTAADLDDFYKRDIETLQARQRSNGSFGLWKRDGERYKYPFLTIHVAHALALAKAKGQKVPDGMIDKAKPYLKDVEKHFDDWYKNAPEARWTISAYALYVRAALGDKDVAKAKSLLAEAGIEKMPFEALGWVLSVIADDPGSKAEKTAILQFLNNRTTETAATANFVTDYRDGAWLIMASNRRADGVLLEAMIKADPQNDLIPKLVRGLLDHRTKGAWSNTQENVFILLALDRYFNAFEKVTPDFVSRIWLGKTYAGEQIFKGRSADSNELTIPMSYLAENGGRSDLIIDKQGAGRLYYRIGMKYAPKDLRLRPADYGFTVLRQYEPVDDKDDVKQNADGSWTFRAGARVRVRLTMVAAARRYHVALVDPLPAGLEILNPGLAVTEAIPGDKQGNTGVITYGSRSYGYGSWWWRQYWFDHQNFRDERAEAFASLLWEGVYTYTYVARATTPGDFIVPPAKAEEMYHPETFGRTGTDIVKVE